MQNQFSPRNFEPKYSFIFITLRKFHYHRRDFNVEADDSAISVFSDTYDLKSLIKELTCYKNPNKTSWIDLILTNKPRNFQHSCVIETGLSDVQKMTVTAMKTFFEKLQLTVVYYKNYKHFENDKFRTDLCQNLVRQI